MRAAIHDQLKSAGGKSRKPEKPLRICLAGCAQANDHYIREILTQACPDPEIESILEQKALETLLTVAPPDMLMVFEGGGIGIERALEVAAQRAPRAVVIVCSSAPTEEAAMRAMEQGAADYIPLDRKWEVSVAAQRALREHEQRQRRKEAEDRLRNHINLLQLQQVVATASNEAHSPEDAAQSVMDIARAYGHFTLAHLFHAAEDDPTRIRASGIWSGYEPERHAAFRERTENFDFSAQVGIATEVLRNGKLAWVSDISTDRRFNRAAAASAAGLRSVVMAPVSAGSEILGVIEFFKAAPSPRDEHLALVLEYVATQLGRVFERDRAERRLESRASEQMVLAELSRKAVEVVNLDDFLAMAARRLEDVLPDCHCLILETTPDGSALRIRATGVDGIAHAQWNRVIPTGSETDLGQALLQGDLLKLDFTSPMPWERPDLLPAEITAALSATIRLRSDIFGALLAYTTRRRDFSRTEGTFLRSAANVLATAAEHSTAFHQLRLLGSAVTQSQDSVMITDADLDPPGPRILFVNPAFTQITGYRVEEVVGFTPRILQGAKTDRAFLQRMHTRLREGKSAQGETVNYRKSGAEFWVEMQVSPLRNPAGEITHFVGIQRDITERKIAEERLRESEEMLAAAQRMAHLGGWVMEYRSGDIEHGKLSWSQEVFRIFGLPPGGIAVTNENFFLAVHPEDREPVAEAFQKALRDHTEYEIDHRIIRPDGVVRIVHEQATALYDEAGNPVRVLGTVQDITERKQAGEEVRHWKERYEMLTKASGQIIFDWEYVTGRITFGGDAERVIGCPPEGLGCTVEDLIARIHPDDQSSFERGRDRQALARGTAEIEYRLRREDNSYITVKDVGYPMLDGNGAITRVLGSITDISSERALEVQLRRSQKMEAFGKLAGGVAHDFNNLLTVITGYNEVVMSEMSENDPRREYIEEIGRATNRASALTSQLLAFSRQQKLQPRVVNLSEVLNDTSRMLARLIGEDIEMRINAPEDLGNVKADVGQIEQVLMNLAVNARDAMPGGGVLTMSTRNAKVPGDIAPDHLSHGDYIMIEVTDSGMGMSPEVQARIFEPFFTTKAPGQGTGLGLATCYGIVKQSGGEIAVQSRLGAGTTFRIYLPRVFEQENAYDIPMLPGELPTGHQTILVVEDELPVRVVIRSVLQRLKYTVLEAANGEEAMRILLTPGRKPVELVMTDLIMPEMGGKELATRARAAFPDIRIIFTSGYPNASTTEMPPGSIFLQKPFSPKTLAESVRDALV